MNAVDQIVIAMKLPGKYNEYVQYLYRYALA